MLRHESRQLPSWLIFDVRQKMKPAVALVLLAFLLGCTSPGSSAVEERYSVRVVTFYGHDGRLAENRVFLCGDTLFHSAEELASIIEAMQPPRKAAFLIENGVSSDSNDPHITNAEIEVIAKACEKMEFDWKLRVKRPNQPPEPTVMLVTPRADARVAPSTTVAHL